MYAGALKLHRNFFSGTIIWGSVHLTEENILLLNNIDIYNYTAVLLVQKFFFNSVSERQDENIQTAIHTLQIID